MASLSVSIAVVTGHYQIPQFQGRRAGDTQCARWYQKCSERSLFWVFSVSLGDIQYIVSPDQNYELVTHFNRKTSSKLWFSERRNGQNREKSICQVSWERMRPVCFPKCSGSVISSTALDGRGPHRHLSFVQVLYRNFFSPLMTFAMWPVDIFSYKRVSADPFDPSRWVHQRILPQPQPSFS